MLLRVPELRQDVAALDVPALDRTLFERLFHVGWRRAIDLMHAFGAYQKGQALPIDGTVLLQQLEAPEAGKEFAVEHGPQAAPAGFAREGQQASGLWPG